VWSTDACMCISTTRTISLGPVKIPVLKPPLNILENVSKRITRFSVSMDNKLLGSSCFRIKNFSLWVIIEKLIVVTYVLEVNEIIGVILKDEEIELASNVVHFLLLFIRQYVSAGVVGGGSQVHQLCHKIIQLKS
jgi:hypothetical protein